MSPAPEPLVVASVLKVQPLRHTRHVVIRCPACGRKHGYVWPYGLTEFVGTRVLHCHTAGATPVSCIIPTPTPKGTPS